MITAKSCVVCGSLEGLNTSMTIKIDDKSHSVLICDEHAEETTVKTAREAFLKRQIEIDDLIAKAKALGIEIPQQPVEQPAAPQRKMLIQDTVSAEGQPIPKGTYRKSEADHILNRRNAQISVASGVAASHGSDIRSAEAEKILGSQLDGHVQLAKVPTRAGVPVVIPAKVSDGLGTTEIQIRPSSDQELQRRFKGQIDKSEAYGSPYDSEELD